MPTLASHYSWIDSAIRGIAVPVAIGVAFRWLRRRYPAHADSSSGDTGEPISGWWTALSVVLWLGAIVAITVVGVASVRAVNNAVAVANGPSRFLLTPTWAWWHLYAGFGGLWLSWLLTAPVMRALMGSERFARWTRGHDCQAGFDTERAVRVLALVVMLPYSFAFLPSIVCHSRFSETDIGIQTYADATEKRYGYSDVAAIAIVKGGRDRAGHLYKDPQIVIDFNDGRRWLSGDSFRDPEDIDPDFAAFIAIKTNLAYRYADAVDDIR